MPYPFPSCFIRIAHFKGSTVRKATQKLGVQAENRCERKAFKDPEERAQGALRRPMHASHSILHIGDWAQETPELIALQD